MPLYTAARKYRLKQSALRHYAKTGTIAATARGIGVSRPTLLQWIDEDPKFALAMAAIDEEITDALESTALTTALEGDPAMLRLLLTTRRPGRFKPAEKGPDTTQAQVVIRFDTPPPSTHPQPALPPRELRQLPETLELAREDVTYLPD